MKRIVSLLLVIVMMAMLMFTVVPISTSAASTSGQSDNPYNNLYWQYSKRDKNHALSQWPDLDYVSIYEDKVTIRFFPRKGYNDWGYRFYISGPKLSWYRIDQKKVADLGKKDSYGRYTVKITLKQSMIQDLYNKYGINDLRTVGKYYKGNSYSLGMYYYPYQVTVRAVNSSGTLLGDFKGSANSHVSPVEVKPFVCTSGDDRTNYYAFSQSAPAIFCETGKASNGEESYRTDVGYQRHQLLTVNGNPAIKLGVGNTCEGCNHIKQIVIYYKNANGNWTRCQYVNLKKTANGNLYSLSPFTFEMKDDMWRKVGKYNQYEIELTARAIDDKGKFVSSFISGTKLIYNAGLYNFRTNQTKNVLTISELMA